MGLSTETVLTAILLFSIFYLCRDLIIPQKAQIPNDLISTEGGNGNNSKSRNFIDLLDTDCKVIIFYGSQTGTSEEYSERIKKEGERKYNLKMVICDPEDYDMENLDKLTKENTVIFIMSTHGEGEPTDNISDFYNMFVDQDNVDLSQNYNCSKEEKPLKNLQFCMFGLGNSTYQHFNKASIELSKALTEFGSKLLGEHGLGDDDKNLEEDFTNWKKNLWNVLIKKYDLILSENKKVGASFEIIELQSDIEIIQHGEFENKINTDIINSKNPFYAEITNSKHLCHLDHERECIHIELDVSKIKNTPVYESGDHVAIWPINPKDEVDLIMDLFNIKDKKTQKIKFKALKHTDTHQLSKIPFFNNTTTYYSLFTYYLDITQPIKREFVEELYEITTLPQLKEYLLKIIENYTLVTSVRATVGKVLLSLKEIIINNTDLKDLHFPNSEIINIKLEDIIENLTKIMPRYYSISSSHKMYPDTIHVTASVLNYDVLLPDKTKRKVYGLCTNNLLAVHDYLNKSNNEKYEIGSMLADYKINTPFVPIYIRKSNFKLPKNINIPIIMIGPGTGLAPLRGFLQERIVQYNENKGEIGTTILYFGCRNEKDYLYKEELEEMFDTLKKKDQNSTLNIAFSRKQKDKIYVQHLILNQKEILNQLITINKARIYVCGDGHNMAKDVFNAFVEVVKISKGNEALDYMKDLKNKYIYMEDVWS